MHHDTAASRHAAPARFAALPLSIAIAGAGGLALTTAAAPAVDYTGTVTGVAAHDQAGGSGGYVPGYVVQPSNGNLHYLFANGDRVRTSTSAVSDVAGVSLTTDGGSSPITLDVAGGSGTLEISTTRAAVGAWGVAIGIDANGVGYTAHGNVDVYAQSDDATPNSAALGVRVQRAPAVFEGDATITTYTPGYSQGLWVYQGAVDFNGTAVVSAQARGTNLCGVYNSGGGASRISFNHGATITALAIHPSDNVHGVYNDNQNSKLLVTGDLDITAASQGSTVFGVRNQGLLTVSGTTQVTANGPRSAFGTANTHVTARKGYTGDVTIAVTNTGSYVPFGNPTGIQNVYPGSSYAHYAGAVHANVQATTEAYAVDNASDVQFTSTTRPVVLGVASSCSGCEVYGIRNQGGSVQAAGGLSVALATGGSGKTHAIWNVGAGNRNGVVNVGGGLVQLSGDVVTGALAGQTGTASTTLDLAAPLSLLQGTVTGYRGADAYYDAGATFLHVGAQATWRPGGYADTADLGGGTLRVDGLGVIDASNASTAALTIDGSGAPATAVVLADQATLYLRSDVSGIAGPAGAERVAFGGGIASFTSPGTLLIAIVDDPLLAAGTLPDTGASVFHPVGPVVVADVTQTGTGSFNAVAGLHRTLPAQIGGTARKVVVEPSLAVTPDRRQIVLSGLWIAAVPSDDIFQSGFEL